MNTQETPQNQFITLDEAKKLITKSKDNKEKVLSEAFKGKDLIPTSETFDRKAIDVLLAQGGCTGLRIYFGMDNDLKVSLVIVGVDEKGEDITKPIALETTSAEVQATQVMGDPIVENGTKCPPTCALNSPLIG